jgi:zinc protease
LVNLQAIVFAGSFDDPADRLGIAGLTFDLMGSAGTAKLGADDLDELLEFLAADADGGASDETSMLNVNLRSEDTEKLLPVFADMLLRPRFDKSRFEIAVASAVESIRRRPDSPDGLAARAVRKAIFGPTSLFAREPTEKTVKAIKLTDLTAFHQKAVVPKATRILVSGDFEREKMLGLLKAQFGNWKGGEPIKRVLPETPKPQRRIFLVPKQTAQAKVRVGGFGYKRLAPEEYAMRVLSTALGSFGVGRMYKEIRDQKGLAYGAYMHVSPGPTVGQFVAATDTKPKTTVQALDAMLQILQETRSGKPLTKQEVSAAADMYLNSFAFRFDSTDKVIREKAVFDLFNYPEDYLDKFRENISAVNPEASTKAANQLFDPEALQIVVVAPKELEAELSKLGKVQVINDVEAFR